MSISATRFWTRFLPACIATKLEGRKNLQDIIDNAGWLIADNVFRMSVGVIIGVWVARYLGPSQFGVLNFALSFVALFGILSTLAHDTIVVRELVDLPEEKNEVMGTAFLLKVIGGVASLFISVGAAYAIRPDDHLTCLLVAILSIGTLFKSFDVIVLFFQAKTQLKFIVLSRACAFVLAVIVRIVMIVHAAPLAAFAGVAALEIILSGLGLLLVYHIHGNAVLCWRIRAKRASSLFKESWPLLIAAFAGLIYQKIDQIMLGQMVGNQALGDYSAALRISEVWYFIPSAVCASILPYVIKAYREDYEKYRLIIYNLFRTLAAVSYFIIIPLSFMSDSLINFLYGSAYAEAANILLIHVWGTLFIFLGVAQYPWSVAERLTRLSLQRTLTGAIVNILLNIWLIPELKGVGAAIATVISYATSACLMNLIDKRTRPIFFLQIKAMLLLRYHAVSSP